MKKKTIIEEETYIPLMQAIADGYPLMDVTQAILFKGFSEGKWNPDLFVLLAEPTAYMLMALAERADIDFVINRGEEEDDDEEEELFGIKYDEEKLKKLNEVPNTGPKSVTNALFVGSTTELQKLLKGKK